jgi:G3E family GTPase
VNEPDQEIEVVEPVYAPWDGRRVPVLLLGGYLGAGKTTLINEMLRRTDVPIAVLVNDVGDVNIDAELIRRQEGDTLDLTGGCVCCSLKNGFLEAFEQLRARPEAPELVVVELSGVADPRPAASLSETPGFAVDSVAVLVDLDQFLDFEAETSVVAESVRAQVEAADVLLLTKRDLVDAEREQKVRHRLAELAPQTPVFLAESAHSAAGLMGLAARRPLAELGEERTLFDQHHTSVIPIDGTMRRDDLQSLVDSFGDDVIRAKGIVQIETGEIVVVNKVGRRRSLDPVPMAETQPTTDIVVISV